MHNKQASCQQGFTLIELMITIAIIAIVLSIAVPSFNDFFEKNRLKRAAEAVYGLVANAKSESTIRDVDMLVTINANAWCVGYAAAANCNCTLSSPSAAGACAVPVAGILASDKVLKVINGSDFSDVTLATNYGASVAFNRLRGTAPGGTLNFVSGNWMLDLVISNEGRVRLCAPAGATAMGYPSC